MSRGLGTRARAALGALAALAAVSAASAANFTVSVAYTASVRGELLGSDDGCSAANETACELSVARTVAHLKAHKAAEAHPLVLETGSYFFGSLFYFRYGTEASAFFFNEAGYDVQTLGTADFFGGVQVLGEYVGALGAGASVATNLAIGGAPALGPDNLVPWRVVDVGGGRLVGVVATVKDSLRSITTFGRGPGEEAVSVTVNPPLAPRLGGLTAKQSVAAAVAELREAHAVAAVVLVYRENGEDAALVAAAGDAVADLDHGVAAGFLFARDIPGVTAVVTLPEDDDSEDFSREPSVLENLFGERVAVYSQPIGATEVAHLDLVLDAAGAGGDGGALAATARVAELDASVAGDAGALAQLAVYEAGVDEFRATRIATLGDEGADGSRENCRFRGCGAGQLIADAMLDACEECDFALVNAGAIRESLPGGNVSRADVLTMLPFPGFLTVLSLTGRDVVTLLRHAVNWGDPSGKFLQWAGLQVAYAPSEASFPLEERLLEISVKPADADEHGDESDFVPLNVGDDVNYTLIVPAFIAGGGDGFDVLSDRGTVLTAEVQPDFREIVAEYLAAGDRAVIDTSHCSSAPANEVPLTDAAVDCRAVENSDVTGVNVLSVCLSDEEVCRSSAREDIFGLPAATDDDCAQCSGLGTCDKVQCVCLVPESGTFKGAEMVRGPECGDVRERQEFWSLGVVLVGGLTVMSGAVILLSLGFVNSYRRHAIIRTGSPLFLQLVNLGGLLLVGAVATMLLDPSELTCGLYAWLFATGVSLTLGALLLKTYRVRELFLNKELSQRVKLTDRRLGAYLLGIVGLNWAVLAAMQVASPLGSKVVLNDPDWKYELACGSDLGEWFVGTLLAINFALLLVCIYYAHAIKDIDSNFNESRFLVAALQNILVVSGIATVAFFATYHGQITGRALLLGMVINILLLSTHGILLMSKMYALRKHTFNFDHTESASVSGDDEDDAEAGGGANSGSATRSQSRSRASRASKPLSAHAAQRLLSRNRELEEEVITLRSKVMRQETRLSIQEERAPSLPRAATTPAPRAPEPVPEENGEEAVELRSVRASNSSSNNLNSA